MVVDKIDNIEIRAVTTPADNQIFLDVPARVYANDPNWVQPLRSSVAKHFKSDNPFLQYGKLQQFIAVSHAVEGSQPVGRIVAAVNQHLITREGENIGLFGFFECMPDFSVASALCHAAEEWLRSQGMTKVRGPIDLSTHNNCLFLVDGFDSPPMVMMPYNPAYYHQFLEKDGWYKAKEAYAYMFLEQPLPPEFAKAYGIACRSGVSFRAIATKGAAFEQDARQIYHLFNRAFAGNWSSTPRSEEEFLAEARGLRSLIDPDIFLVAEYAGEMVGFWMGLPDLNIPLKHVNGKLNWLGTLKFLWYKRKIDQVRVIGICSLPEYRRKMVPLALIYLGMQGGTKPGKPYKRAELSWVYENNSPSRKLIESAGGKIYKTYRIYEKDL